MSIPSRAQVWVQCEDGLWWPAKVVRPAEDVMSSIALNHEDCCVEFYHNPGELYPVISSDTNTVQPLQRQREHRSRHEEARFANSVTRNAVLQALRDDPGTAATNLITPQSTGKSRSPEHTALPELRSASDPRSCALRWSPSPQRPSSPIRPTHTFSADSTTTTTASSPGCTARQSPILYSSSEIRNIHALLGAVGQSTAEALRHQLETAGISISATTMRKQMRQELTTQKRVRTDHRARVLSMAARSNGAVSHASASHPNEAAILSAVSSPLHSNMDHLFENIPHSAKQTVRAAEAESLAQVMQKTHVGQEMLPWRKRNRVDKRASRAHKSLASMPSATTSRIDNDHTQRLHKPAAPYTCHTPLTQRRRTAMLTHLNEARVPAQLSMPIQATSSPMLPINQYPEVQSHTHNTQNADSGQKGNYTHRTTDIGSLCALTHDPVPPWQSRSRTRDSDNSTEAATCVSAHVLDVLRKEVFENAHTFVLSPVYRFIEILGAVTVDNDDIITRLPAPSALRERPSEGFHIDKRVLLLPLTNNYDHTSGWMQPLEVEDKLYAMSLIVNHLAVSIPPNWNITPAKLARAVKTAPVIDITDVIMSNSSDIITLEICFTHTSAELMLWSGIVACIFVEKLDLTTIADRIAQVYRAPHQPSRQKLTSATAPTQTASTNIGRDKQRAPQLEHAPSTNAAATTATTISDATNTSDCTNTTVNVTGACVSLRCPLTTLPMKIPARGADCEHLQCMDLYAIVHQCVQSNIWNCPMCDAPMRPRDICINYRLKEWITNNSKITSDVHYIIETNLETPLQIHMKKKRKSDRNETVIDLSNE